MVRSNCSAGEDQRVSDSQLAFAGRSLGGKGIRHSWFVFGRCGKDQVKFSGGIRTHGGFFDPGGGKRDWWAGDLAFATLLFG